MTVSVIKSHCQAVLPYLLTYILGVKDFSQQHSIDSKQIINSFYMEQKEIPTSSEKWFIYSNVIEKRNSPCWAAGIAAIILLSHSFINLCRHWFNGLES